MTADGPLLPWPKHVPEIRSDDPQDESGHVVCTRDHEMIRQWASARRAEPATGQATATGPATTISVNDTGAGVRFNFPGAARFRPISWDEWFEHFDRHELAFVFDQESAKTSTPSSRYQIIKFADWKGIIG